MKKQTAVEQFKQEFFGYADPYPYFSEEDKWVITEKELLELLEKAKQIDEKNLKDSFIAGAGVGEMFNNENRCFVSDADKYFKETFKSE